jgi:FKBP-type peptidyl-prolyl cis-trans isomerase
MSITKKETATEQDDSTKKASIEEATKEKVEPTGDENSVNKDSWERLMGDDLLMKSLGLTGEAPVSTPVQPQDAVVIDFVGRLAPTLEDSDGPIFQEAKDWLIVIGEKNVLPALEMGVRFMKLGETAVVWSHSKYAYGPSGRVHGDYNLPADSDVRYQITVKSILSEEKRSEPETLIQLGLAKKEIGNDAYANEWSDGMGKDRIKLLYQRAVKDMEFIVQSSEHSEEIRDQATTVMLDCLNNIAAVQMRAKEFHAAKATAVQVLSYDPDNFKGLMRAAKAALLDPASSYEEVDAAIRAAAEKSGANQTDVQRLRADFKRRKQDYDQKSKAMFSKLGKTDAKPSKEAIKNDTEVKESEEKSRKPEMDVVPNEAALDSSEKATVWWKRLPWKDTILPYGFQLLMPFVMYYYFTIAKARQEAKYGDSTTTPSFSTGAEEL